jgi:cell division protein FtsQ
MTIKKTIVKKFFTILWLAIGTGAVVLLAAAIKKKDAEHCTGVTITIEGVDNNFFVDKKDILNIITAEAGGSPAGKGISAFDLGKLETELEKDIWVKQAQLFFDNNNRLIVKVLEREPVARIFVTGGATFYIDSSLAMLPLSEKFSARLPVFTGFPSDKKVLSHADSILLKDILTVSTAILKDSFGMALIDQVDITAQRNFEMIPKMGTTTIVFGDAGDMQEKLRKLLLFYREVVIKSGWNKYSEINVQYKGQIVAKRKGALEIASDSLRTLQLMMAIAENTERQTSDSLRMIATDDENNTTNADIIQQSIQRDDEHGPGAAEKMQPQATQTLTVTGPGRIPVKKPVTAKPITPAAKSNTTAAKRVVKTTAKQIIKPAPGNAAAPKAVMPKPITKKTNNEY